jgi:hypothetical protein
MTLTVRTLPPWAATAVRTEADVQSVTRLHFDGQGRLWRNNVGALLDARGRPVRYGLANESAGMNAQIKSSDLIGWTERVITAGMVGQRVAVFTSYECKAPNWKGGNTPHEQAQARWLQMVADAGGIGEFVTMETV